MPSHNTAQPSRLASSDSMAVDDAPPSALSVKPAVAEALAALSHAQALAPDFAARAVAPGGAFVDFALSQRRGKWVVLHFYGSDFAPDALSDLLSFADRSAEFKGLNAEIWAVSVDSVFTHRAWMGRPRSAGGLEDANIHLISDITKEIVLDYSLLITDGPGAGTARRCTMVIDPSGIVQHAVVDNMSKSGSAEAILKLLSGGT
ncbi:peroxiredoxin, partial [Cladochytrium tenue]